MKRTYFKLLWRGVWRTKARFLSILAIVAVGVGFLGGLLATTPDMQRTVDTYYDENHIFDLYVRASAGLTEEDVAALRESGRFSRVMPAHVEDLLLSDGEETLVARVYAVPLSERGGAQFVNDFVFTEGEMPKTAGECLVASPSGFLGTTHAPGDVLRLSEESESTVFDFDALTVSGVVSSPQYISVQHESSTVGRGQVELIVYVFPELASLDVYTDVYLTLEGAEALNAFSDSYTARVDEAAEFLETFGATRSQLRYEQLYSEAADTLADAEAELAEGRADYETAKREAEDELDAQQAQLDEARAELEAGEEELNARREELTLGEQSLDEAERALNEALAAAEGNEAYYALVEQQLAPQREALEAQRQTLDEARAALEDAEAELAEGREALDEGTEALAQAREDAETQLRDAEAELDEAQGEIDDGRAELAALEVPEWYLFDRMDTISFSGYKSDSEKVAAIAKVFPVFFFLVAALVALTTMTRMVEEERTQIGTLKALGYTRGAITLYYVGYSVLATLVGSIVGLIIGYNLLPAVIANAYTILYSVPPTVTRFYWNYTLIVVPIAVVCTTAATLFACLSQLSERPSTLMLPRAPKSGKRVLLERVGFLWRHLSFTKKVTVRNIFRYKKRFYMTVIGIAGCCALLVTGFGLRDSIRDIVDLQFGEIYRYNLSVYLSENSVEERDPILSEFLQNSPYLERSASFAMSTGSVENGGKSGSVNLYVPRETSDLPEMFTLRNRRSGASIAFDEDAFLLTEKLCEQLDIEVGERVTLRNADGRSATFTVTGICENYVSASAFLSAASYEAAFGAAPDYRLLLLNLNDESHEARDAISEQLLHSDNILLLQFSQNIREGFENTVKNIDYIVVVLILAAALLAVIVVYNLTNINICERQRELATIKVLGFHEGEVARYIYRETTVLCILGILVGFVLGIWLHAFVSRTAEVDAVMFGRTIYARSYLLSALVTLVFTGLVDLIMLKKLRAIDMVESLKANE